MSGKKRRKPAPSATPWDSLGAERMTPAQALVHATHKSAYVFRHESFAGDIEFFNSYVRTSCPWCGDGDIKKSGHRGSGMQRYYCNACKKTFTPATGTIFDSRRLPLSAWTDFLIQTFSYASVALMTREDRRSDTTLPYWVAKLFAVLDGVQDDAVLAGKVWIDEAYWPVAAKDAVHTAAGKLPRGLSVNQICIGIGVDGFGRSVCLEEGLAKTNATKTWDAFGDKIKPGSTLIHDLEPAHNQLVRKLGLRSERHNAKLLKGIPDKDNPLEPVNRMCHLLKSFLRSHSGFNRNDMQGYLNLFHVMMNAPEDKMEKAAFVLDRAMRNPKTIRFRDFYNVKSSSDNQRL